MSRRVSDFTIRHPELFCFFFFQVLLCFLIGAFVGFSLSAEGDSSARLLVSKNILNQYVVEGKELTVHYNIFNVGSG